MKTPSHQRLHLIFASLRWRLHWLSVALVAIGTTLVPVDALAYSEYQVHIAKTSKRTVNCAYCHAHPDGPEGTAHGQIGSLTPDQIKKLQEARSAFEPGRKVDNPLLNPFGNHLIEALGKKEFLEMRITPGQLVEKLDPQSDMDQDGIADVQEIRDGTHPLLKSDGHPWLLFRHNFQKDFGQIAVTLIATIAGLYGLRHLLRGFAIVARAEHRDEDENGAEDHPR